MCTNETNMNQAEILLEYLDDSLALQCRWSHKLAHALENTNSENLSDKLHSVGVSLLDAREALSEAKLNLYEMSHQTTPPAVKLM